MDTYYVSTWERQMDTSIAPTCTDTLARPTAPRRMRTMEEKRRIVEETMKRGASVAVVARRHEVNANLLFGWRRLYQKGLLEPNAPAVAAPLLPVQLTSPTVVPRRSGTRRRRIPSVRGAARRGDFLEIELAGGGRICVYGKAAARILEQLIEELCRR